MQNKFEMCQGLKRQRVFLSIFFVLIMTEFYGQVNDSIICAFPVHTDQVDDVLMFPDVMPEFPGGAEAFLKYIGENIEYPQVTNGCSSGTVYIKFVINKDGSAKNFILLRGIGVAYDEEAMRVLKTIDNWCPGEHNGELVESWYVVPIKFSLQ